MNTIKFDIDSQGIAHLTLSRAEVHNAFDDQMITEIRGALAKVRVSSQARVLVLKAEGKSFSAGADLNWMRSMAKKNYDENIADSNQLAALMRELDQLPIPTLALVQGAAFGGAVGLVACCDFAVATQHASFCLSEVKIGLIPAVISPYVIQKLGYSAARRFMITAERFRAEKALALGLIHEAVEDIDAAEQVIAQLITQLLANSPQAMHQAKKLAQDVYHAALDDQLIAETSRRIANIRVSEEGQEGLTAFLEKRPAGWILPEKPHQ